MIFEVFKYKETYEIYNPILPINFHIIGFYLTDYIENISYTVLFGQKCVYVKMKHMVFSASYVRRVDLPIYFKSSYFGSRVM